ncbi:MAG TPA: IS3 family transposase [Candidatus Limnocylindrales bacterium]|nr:IS3 family transposase [Candidatus Limnocylindrales bacterium]
MYRFVEREKASHHLATLCRVLGVSRTGYHAWAHRPVGRRLVADAGLTTVIATIHRTSRGTYGAPRVHAVLQARGVRVSRKRVARLMADAGLVGVHRRRRARPIRRVPVRAGTTAPDLVRRRFRATAPDRLWVADITELPTGEGALYLAAIVDVFSRACVGWSMAGHLRTELVIRAVDAAVDRRRPRPGLIHHSDRGTQYTSLALGARLAAAGIAASMGFPGSGLDNALAESFFASLETELIDRSSWPTRAAARCAVFDWIERFYNRVRIHSRIGYVSPAEFERRHSLAQNV